MFAPERSNHNNNINLRLCKEDEGESSLELIVFVNSPVLSFSEQEDVVTRRDNN